MAKHYVIHLATRHYGALKPEYDRTAWLATHPGWAECHKMPSMAKLEQMAENGVAKATDGCRVEPDGHCPHGHPSWLLVAGVI